MNPLTGIVLKLLSVILFTVMAAILKATAHEVPAGEQMFFRSLFAIPVILIWLACLGKLRTGLRTRNPMSHVYRGLVGSVAMGTGFVGLGLLPFPEVTALGYAMPLLTVIFAAMFLNERVGVFRLSMVALGLIGVLIVLSPRMTAVSDGVSDAESLGAVMTLIGASFGALSQIFISRMVITEQTSSVVFWFSATATLMSLVTVPFGWTMPSPTTAALLVTAGLMGGVAQILLTSAYKFADASLVAPFDYASMLLALIIGWFVFNEGASPRMLVGAAVIIVAGVVIIIRERRLGINRARRASTPR